jgi:hypothetical protein
MRIPRILAGSLAAVLALGGIGTVLASTYQTASVDPVEINTGVERDDSDRAPQAPALAADEIAARRDDADLDDGLQVIDVPDEPTGDGDDTAGDDGTSGGDNTGDGDSTKGDDGTSGGNNTGDGDNTRGDDGTSGGNNSGDGDATKGDDGTSGGNNTGDGDNTRGDDGTSGGNNTASNTDDDTGDDTGGGDTDD